MMQRAGHSGFKISTDWKKSHCFIHGEELKERERERERENVCVCVVYAKNVHQQTKVF